MTNADLLEKGGGRASQTVCGGELREARTVGGALGLLEVQLRSLHLSFSECFGFVCVRCRQL